jgi:hypothetical protein
MWAIPLPAHGILQAGLSPSSIRVRRGGYRGSWRMAGRRRSARSRGSEGLCPIRIPKNRAAISIRSTRPPIITVIGGPPVGARLKCHSSRLEMTLPGGYRVNLSGRGERQDFVASAVVLDKVRQLCLDKFNVSLGGGLDRSRAASSASGISAKRPPEAHSWRASR